MILSNFIESFFLGGGIQVVFTYSKHKLDTYVLIICPAFEGQYFLLLFFCKCMFSHQMCLLRFE